MNRQRKPGGTSATLYRDVASARLWDAKTLFKHKRYGGSLYLTGYAVECALKWAVARKLATAYLPAKHETHSWDQLVPHTAIEKALKTDGKMSAIYSEMAETWDPELRYRSKEPAVSEATNLYGKLEAL